MGHPVTSRSLWWSWVAPYTGIANFSTYGSSRPLALGVFVGTDLPFLSQVGRSNVSPWTTIGLSIFDQPERGDQTNILVRSGETYQILVSLPAESSQEFENDRVVLGINQKPSIVSRAVIAGRVGESMRESVLATNGANEFYALGVPPGLRMSRFHGGITGSPSLAGTFDALVAVSGPGGRSTATLRFLIEPSAASTQLPSLSSQRAWIKGIRGRRISNTYFNVAGPNAVLSAASLPPGLALTTTANGGYLSGIPSTAGVFRTALAATNSAGSAVAEMTVDVRALPSPPILTSQAAFYGRRGTSFSASIQPSDISDTTYSIRQLPPGLSASSNFISGTPTQIGSFEVPVTATNPGGTTSGTITIVIEPEAEPSATEIPVVLSSAGLSAWVGARFSYSVQASDAAAEIEVGPLPAGLSFDRNAKVIRGTPTEPGAHLITVSARNAYGTSTTPLSLSVNQLRPLPITTSAGASGVVGQQFRYPLSAAGGFFISDSPVVTIASEDLPPGLVFTPSQSSIGSLSSLALGVIEGTPTEAGTYRIPFSARVNGAGIACILTLTINGEGLPVIRYPLCTVAQLGGVYPAGAMEISNGPIERVTVENLPEGFSFDPTTLKITGTATSHFRRNVTIKAANSSGETSVEVVIATVIEQKPTLGIRSNLYARINDDVSYPLDVRRFPSFSSATSSFVMSVLPITYGVLGLPPGMYFNEATGRIEGRTARPGIFPIIVSTADRFDEIATPFTLHVSDGMYDPAPGLQVAAQVPLTLFGAVGSPLNVPIRPAGFAGDVRSTPLPPGLTLEVSTETLNGVRTRTATVRGSPTASGVYPVTFSFSRDQRVVSAVVTFHVPVVPEPPEFAGSLTAVGRLGTEFNFPIGTTAGLDLGNAATRIEFDNLPPGIIYDETALALTGVPTETGNFLSSVRLTNFGGTTTGSLAISIAEARLVAPRLATNVGATNVVYLGENLNIEVTADATITGITIPDLPEGIALRRDVNGRWILHGEIQTPGTFNLVATAISPVGSTVTPLTLDVRTFDDVTRPPETNPDPTPTPTALPESPPSTIRAILAFNHPSRLVTREDSIRLRGRVLRASKPSGISVRIGTKPPKNVRINRRGSFVVRASSLSVGRTPLVVRLSGPHQKSPTRRVIIIRLPSQ